jgi:hypothetical protein
MFDQIEKEAETNKVNSGNISAIMPEILKNKEVAAITRFGCVESYIIPKSVWDTLKEDMA